MSSAVVEIVAEDDYGTPDRVAAWLALGQIGVRDDHGAKLFELGVPCQRRKVRDAIVRHVWKNDGNVIEGADAAWDDGGGGIVLDGSDGVASGAEVEPREIEPAEYVYQAPAALAFLAPGLAQWVYKTFQAMEIDAMYRLRENKNWQEFVEELREGMEAKAR